MGACGRWRITWVSKIHNLCRLCLPFTLFDLRSSHAFLAVLACSVTLNYEWPIMKITAREYILKQSNFEISSTHELNYDESLDKLMSSSSL